MLMMDQLIKNWCTDSRKKHNWAYAFHLANSCLYANVQQTQLSKFLRRQTHGSKHKQIYGLVGLGSGIEKMCARKKTQTCPQTQRARWNSESMFLYA